MDSARDKGLLENLCNRGFGSPGFLKLQSGYQHNFPLIMDLKIPKSIWQSFMGCFTPLHVDFFLCPSTSTFFFGSINPVIYVLFCRPKSVLRLCKSVSLNPGSKISPNNKEDWFTRNNICVRNLDSCELSFWNKDIDNYFWGYDKIYLEKNNYELFKGPEIAKNRVTD